MQISWLLKQQHPG